MVKEDAKTIMNRLKSSRSVKGFSSGARINRAERYWARIIIGMLYPRTTENKLNNFRIKTLFFLLDTLKLVNDFQFIIF